MQCAAAVFLVTCRMAPWQHVPLLALVCGERRPTVVLCLSAAADDSGSMAFEENGERVEDLKMIGSKVRQ